MAFLALAAIIIAISIPRGASPSAIAQRFLQAVSASDAKTLGELIDDSDESVVAAVKHVEAATSPITAIKVEEVSDWGAATDGVVQTDVPYSFTLNGETFTGVLTVARTNEGEQVPGATAFTGVVALPEMEGVRAGVKGADSTGGSVALFPGTYGVAKPDMPFPFFIAEDEVAVMPGESTTIAARKDDAKVQELVSSLTAGAEQAAVTAAKEALSAGTIPLDGLQVGAHAGQNVKYTEIAEYLPPSYVDSQVTFRYLTTFDGDKWIGALSQEWVTMQSKAKVIVTYTIDDRGTASAASTIVDTSESVWGQLH
ncbi:hypothetical protein [Microbacterium nymphoidis]|uniref:hypothetical protein n=1 Tax=Microbacterium nymphoidis TaxID=2898586 RepID=UPI001E2A0362|nr:hypothetical protein [Microbacterium nymphoidis]MCD2498509.1 hypothetical protein [Microbacterium nymphoidis]